MDWIFFLEVVIGGMLAGVMYSLVALGFVLIYKASGVLNFAQGSMVYLAALVFVILHEKGIIFPLAIAATIGMMILLGFLIERIVLRPLVNQPPMSLFMATIGLAFFLEAFTNGVSGTQTHILSLGIEDMPFKFGAINISKYDLFSAAITLILIVVLAAYYQKTRIGRALRAVADDHQAAVAVGIPLDQIWAIVWSVAGCVALVTGLLWGSRTGVQLSLASTALKGLPVLILGGFTSIPGAIVGGLIIGTGEKLAEIYVGSSLGLNIGTGIENWFPYVLALLFLLVRPEGIFGEKHIDRV